MKVQNKDIYLVMNKMRKSDKTADEIPTLISSSALETWQKGDDDPYYKVQEIDYPIVANGDTYTGAFFQSYIAKLKDYPIPGSKRGHYGGWGERQNTDLLLVGGQVEELSDGKGKVYFKNYIPPEGESGSNAVFIKENQTGMVEYSLVAFVDYEVKENAKGEKEYFITKSIKGERNDAVPVGLGAMNQKTNSDQNIGEENHNMEPKEMLDKLSVLKKNGDLALSEIADAFGIKVLNKEDAQLLIDIKQNLGDNPVEAIKRLKAEVETGKSTARENLLNATYGLKENAEGVENPLRVYAENMTAGLFGADLDLKVAALKTDSIALKLAGESQDERKLVVDKQSDQNTGDKIPVYEG